MILTRLSLSGFRNYTSLEFIPHPSVNYFHGPNGAGKTNLLEAIYFLAHLQSFRRTPRAKIVNTDSQGLYVSGEFEQNDQKLRLEASIFGKDRRYRVDGKREDSLASYLGRVFVSVFHPESLGLIRGGSLQRRAFFDRAISAEEIGHLMDLRQYNRLLAERNKILKENFSFSTINTWSERLIVIAAKIIKRREDYLQSFRQQLLSLENNLGITLENKPKIEYLAGSYFGDDRTVIPNIDDITRKLEKVAGEIQEKERRKKVTLFGPHLDDFGIFLGKKKAKDFASQGEQRLLIILMVLAAAKRYKQAKNKSPIILLDDLSSELDEQKRIMILGALDAIKAQVFIASTETLNLTTSATNQKSFHVVKGSLETSSMIS